MKKYGFHFLKKNRKNFFFIVETILGKNVIFINNWLWIRTQHEKNSVKFFSKTIIGKNIVFVKTDLEFELLTFRSATDSDSSYPILFDQILWKTVSFQKYSTFNRNLFFTLKTLFLLSGTGKSSFKKKCFFDPHHCPPSGGGGFSKVKSFQEIVFSLRNHFFCYPEQENRV